jgi:hypothetical protein
MSILTYGQLTYIHLGYIKIAIAEFWRLSGGYTILEMAVKIWSKKNYNTKGINRFVFFMYWT